MELLLGIDVGTGGCKTTLLNEKGGFVADGYKEYKTYHPRMGYSEQKPSDWFPAFLYAFNEALKKASVKAESITGLSVSASTHNAVLLDSTFNVIRDVIMWTDQRSIVQSERLKANHGSLIFSTTYEMPAATWTLPQLMWIKEHEPDVFKRIHYIMFIKDFIRYQLTGVWCTDYIDAQGSMLFDNNTLKWSADICEIGGIPMHLLPPLVKPSDVCGRVTMQAAELTGIPAGTPVVAGTSDTALEHYSVGGIRQGDCIVKIATSSTVDIMAHEAHPHLSGFVYSQIPEGLWTTCFATNSAAASLRWYRDTFCRAELDMERKGGANVYGFLDEEAIAIPPGSSGLFFHPYLMGERSPHWDAKLRGSFIGITAHHTRGHFNRAILEGVAYSIRENFEIACDMCPVEEVRLVGGGAKSGLWTEIVANMLNKQIIKFNNDDSSFGAAMLAGVGIGVFASHEDAIKRCVKECGRVLPSPDVAEVYKKSFAIYKQIHEDLRETYGRL